MISYPDNVACLADYIESVLEKFADRPAYTALGQTVTFKDIDEKSEVEAQYSIQFYSNNIKHNIKRQTTHNQQQQKTNTQ